MTNPLIEELERAGVRLFVRKGKLGLRGPKAAITPAVVAQVSDHKQELLQLLGSPRLKYPGAKASSEEIREILERVHGEGYILLWSNVLQDLVAFYRDEESGSKIPPGFVPYSEAELKELFGDDKPSLSLSALRAIHDVKKYGGRVINGEGDSVEGKNRG